MGKYHSKIVLENGRVIATLMEIFDGKACRVLDESTFEGVFFDPSIEKQYDAAVKWTEKLIKTISKYHNIDEITYSWKKPE